MSVPPLTPIADAFVAQLFASKSARTGGVIRRRRRNIETYVGIERFVHEVQIRGFQAFANGDQIIIICNQAPLCPLGYAHKNQTPAPQIMRA